MNKLFLNVVRDFNPYDFLEPAVDWATGEPITDPESGEVKKYLPVRAQQTWFRLLYPEGKIVLKEIPTEEFGWVKFSAEVYADKNDPEGSFLAIAYAERFKIQDPAYPVFETCQTAAVGRALTIAGFGCELKTFVSGEDTGAEIINRKPTVDDAIALIDKKEENKKESIKAEKKPKKEKEKIVEEVPETSAKIEDNISGENPGEVVFEIKQGAGSNTGNLQLHIGQSLEEVHFQKPKLLKMIASNEKLRNEIEPHVIEAIDAFLMTI